MTNDEDKTRFVDTVARATVIMYIKLENPNFTMEQVIKRVDDAMAKDAKQ